MKGVLLAFFLLLPLPSVAQWDGCAPGFCSPSAGISAPTITLDFVAGTATGSCASFAACLSVARASPATDLLSTSAQGYAFLSFSNNVLAISPQANTGLLDTYEARTNSLLNSGTPATQTTGSLGTGTYTLWVNGSGTATMSAGSGTGCGTSAASQGTPVSFTITVAGTCTVTVAGSLNQFQLENGAFPTPYIVTTGAAASRVQAIVTAAGNLDTIMNSTSGSFVINVGATPNLANGYLTSANGAANVYIVAAASNTQCSTSIIASQLNATLGSGTYSANSTKNGASWDATGRMVVCNNGTAATDANIYAHTTPNYIGNRNAANSSIDTPISKITVYSPRATDATVKAATQ